MQRGPHEPDPDRLAVDQHARQRLRLKAIDPRPESDIRIRRFLRLEADQGLERLGRRALDARQQALPGEERSI
jgi:hypothetical protein